MFLPLDCVHQISCLEQCLDGIGFVNMGEDMEVFEDVIEQYLRLGFAIGSGFFSVEVIEGLRNNLLQKKASGMMHPAGIGAKFDFQTNLRVRGDSICWIENNSTNHYECIFLDRIRAFSTYLNQTCFTRINDMEFHYAYYDKGSFYKRHRDQFRADKGRQFSFVLYLNEDWHEEDGGELRMFYPEYSVYVQPKLGNIVFFKSSEVEHEVRKTERARMSIAGWLKSMP